MKTFVKWTALVAGAAAGVAFARAWAAALQKRLDRGLEHGERIAEATRATLQQADRTVAEAEAALHATRTTVS